MRNGAQLIAYADRLGGGGIGTVRELLEGPLAGAFTGVHLLPFYRPFDGADAGFDPIDHREVDPRLGTWDDVAALARTHDVTADLIVNHVSDRSPQFVDFLARGDDSPYAGMFLDIDRIFPGGLGDDALAAVYRPRPGRPVTTVTLADGSERRMWTTFTSHQIDIDTHGPEGRAYLSEVLDLMADAGVAQVRLDAIGYAVKTPGTSCFMTPATTEFIELVGEEIRRRGMVGLLEVHSHHADQVAIAMAADRVYDFALPPLVLHGLRTGSALELRRWLAGSPRNAVTVLDTHDGIGVVDVGPDDRRPGLLDADQIDELVEGIHTASGGESRRATGAAASNLDLYQVNCTYYSALGGDDERYLLARLIQFLAPGVPQVYYAGLLAARNDLDLLARTGEGRDINRPYLTLDDVDRELQRPVVRRLLGLCRWRSDHPAFAGGFEVDGDDRTLRMTWTSADATVDADIDLATARFEVRSTVGATTTVLSRWADLEP